ncbi:MAG: hypothetical protein ACLSCV_09430 [Acutalibacteraceae bacterium]
MLLAQSGIILWCWHVLWHGVGKYDCRIIIGIVGILLLLSLIPLTKGIKE